MWQILNHLRDPHSAFVHWRARNITTNHVFEALKRAYRCLHIPCLLTASLYSWREGRAGSVPAGTQHRQPRMVLSPTSVCLSVIGAPPGCMRKPTNHGAHTSSQHQQRCTTMSHLSTRPHSFLLTPVWYRCRYFGLDLQMLLAVAVDSSWFTSQQVARR